MRVGRNQVHPAPLVRDLAPGERPTVAMSPRGRLPAVPIEFQLAQQQVWTRRQIREEQTSDYLHVRTVDVGLGDVMRDAADGENLLRDRLLASSEVEVGAVASRCRGGRQQDGDSRARKKLERTDVDSDGLGVTAGVPEQVLGERGCRELVDLPG